MFQAVVSNFSKYSQAGKETQKIGHTVHFCGFLFTAYYTFFPLSTWGVIFECWGGGGGGEEEIITYFSDSR